jgi:hypothetical protein
VIRDLSELGERIVASGCACEEKDREEPRHSLGHALQRTAETIDAVADGKLELPATDVRTLERWRDQLIPFLDW